MAVRGLSPPWAWTTLKSPDFNREIWKNLNCFGSHIQKMFSVNNRKKPNAITFAIAQLFQ